MNAIIFAALLALPSALQAAQTACVYDKGGIVEVERGGKSFSASKGALLEQGDKVKAGKDAWVELLMAEGTFIRLEAGTEASLDELGLAGGERSFSFGLLRGKALWLAAKLKNLAAAKKFSVRTPSAVCAVRGTDFTVIVSTSGETSIGLFEGKVAVSPPAGPEQELLPGGEARASGQGVAVESRMSALMKAEQRRYERVKKRVDDLRKRMQEREDFIGEYSKKLEKKLSERDARLKERLEKRQGAQ